MKVFRYVITGLIPALIAKSFFNNFEGGFFSGVFIVIMWIIIDEIMLESKKSKQ